MLSGTTPSLCSSAQLRVSGLTAGTGLGFGAGATGGNDSRGVAVVWFSEGRKATRSSRRKNTDDSKLPAATFVNGILPSLIFRPNVLTPILRKAAASFLVNRSLILFVLRFEIEGHGGGSHGEWTAPPCSASRIDRRRRNLLT